MKIALAQINSFVGDIDQMGVLFVSTSRTIHLNGHGLYSVQIKTQSSGDEIDSMIQYTPLDKFGRPINCMNTDTYSPGFYTSFGPMNKCNPQDGMDEYEIGKSDSMNDLSTVITVPQSFDPQIVIGGFSGSPVYVNITKIGE